MVAIKRGKRKLGGIGVNGQEKKKRRLLGKQAGKKNSEGGWITYNITVITKGQKS